MQTTSNNYKVLLENKQAEYEVGVYVGNTFYSAEHIERDSMRTYGTLYNGKNGPTIGGATSREISLTLKGYQPISKNAVIRPQVRRVLRNRLTGEITAASEWLNKGVFYLDSRNPDDVSGTIQLHGFDIMLILESIPGDLGTDWFGMTPKTYVETLVQKLTEDGWTNVSVDERSTIYDNVFLLKPTERTNARQVMNWIATLHGANWTVSESGAFRLIPLSVAYSEAVLANEYESVILIGNTAIGVQGHSGGIGGYLDLGREVDSLSVLPAFSPVTKVVISGKNGESFSAGTDGGYVVEAECGFADNEEWAEVILNNSGLSGYIYRPLRATNAILDPAVELGDVVIVSGVAMQIASMTTIFDELMTADIDAPSERESEYPKSTSIMGRDAQTALDKAKDYTDEVTLTVEVVDELPEDHAEHNTIWVIPYGTYKP